MNDSFYENDYGYNGFARGKFVGVVITDLKELALRKNQSVENDVITLENISKQIATLNEKYESLDENKQQDIFGGEFGTSYKYEDGHVYDMMRPVNSTRVPLYLHLDIITSMLDENFINNPEVSEENRYKASEIKEKVMELREKVAGLKYNEMFNSYKQIDDEIAKSIAKSKNYTFSTEVIDNKEYLSINITSDSSKYTEEEMKYDIGKITASGEGFYTEIGLRLMHDNFYPVIKTITNEEKGDTKTRFEKGLVFDEDIKSIKEKAEDKKIMELKNKYTEQLKEYFPNGTYPNLDELDDINRIYGDNAEVKSCIAAIRSIVYFTEVSYQNPAYHNKNNLQNLERDLEENIGILSYNGGISLEIVSRTLDSIRKTKTKKEAEDEWKSNSMLWRVKNRKLNPKKVDLDNTSIEKLEELKEMLTDDVKDDDGPTK